MGENDTVHWWSKKELYKITGQMAEKKKLNAWGKPDDEHYLGADVYANREPIPPPDHEYMKTIFGDDYEPK